MKDIKLPIARKTTKQQLGEIAKVFGLTHNCNAHIGKFIIRNKTEEMIIEYCKICLDLISQLRVKERARK